MPPPSLWRHIQKTNFTDLRKLLLFLDLPIEERIEQLIERPFFTLNLPKRLAEKIKKSSWDDPILRQFLPAKEELILHPLFMKDPVEDAAFCKTPKLLHKYQARALIVTTSACAMHCRYCFRQNFEYETQEKGFQKELIAIQQDPSLKEILLSGGDPLSLSDLQLTFLLQELSKISHLKRIRFHTRFPIGIPERIDDSFLSILKNCTKQIVFVIHCNHSNEFDEEIFKRLKYVQQLGIPVLSQTVLLKGVNDTLYNLKNLFELLIDHGILPYYLHQLDRVQGAAHFEVPESIGLSLMEELARELPGYALPRYVKEISHASYKTPLKSDAK